MNGKPLATVEDLQGRLAFDMSPEEQREALGALTDLSDEARSLGSSSWLSPESAPSAICNLVLRAAARYMKNYEGYVQSRAGDETLVWSDQKSNAGAAYFTQAERDSIRQNAGLNGLHSVPVFAWGTTYRDPEADDAIYVPTTSGYVFPWRKRGDRF